MKEYWIETDPIRFCAIYDMHISIGINKHGTALIKGYIEDEWEEEYAAKLVKELWVSITAADNGGNKEVIFCGLVTGFMFTAYGGQRAMELELKSGTSMLDLNSHTRFFQDVAVTYGDICRQLKGHAKGQRIGKGAQLDAPINGLVVQNEETDWEFLIRLLSNCHSFLMPEVKGKGVLYTIGMPDGKERILEEKKYSMEKNLEEYRKKKVDGMVYVREADCIICHAEMREICSLGDFFNVMGLVMYVYEIEFSYIRGEIISICKAKTLKGLQTCRILSETISGISFEAVVREVKQDKVRLAIKNDENEGMCEKKWFPFSTPYSTSDGTGWYCMPEVGDCVRLQFPDSFEDNAYAISAVHLQTENGERNNPKYKILKNKQQKEIRFTPDSIIITNNRGMKIEMVDEKGIKIESDKSILIEAGEDINIVSDAASLMLAADTSLVLNQGGTSIQLEDGIRFMGGEFHVQ